MSGPGHTLPPVSRGYSRLGSGLGACEWRGESYNKEPIPGENSEVTPSQVQGHGPVAWRVYYHQPIPGEKVRRVSQQKQIFKIRVSLKYIVFFVKLKYKIDWFIPKTCKKKSIESTNECSDVKCSSASSALFIPGWSTGPCSLPCLQSAAVLNKLSKGELIIFNC